MAKRLFRLAAGAVAAALVATTAMAEMVYHRGNTAVPGTLDHHKAATPHGFNILRDLYEGLVVYDAGAQIVPGVAQSWTVSDDALTYRFKLRDNAKWSNGDRVRAHDFVFAFQRALAPDSGAPFASILYPISNARAVNKGDMEPVSLGARALDDTTLEITLQAATPYFLELLAQQIALPMHKASLAGYGSDVVKPGDLVSNGAYVLASFKPGKEVVVTKNPNFYDAANVRIDKVIYYPTADRAVALRRFRAGELHSNNDAPSDELKFLKQSLGEQFRVAPYLGTYYYAVKTDSEPFSDVRVRQALSMAIDREFLAEEIWGDTMFAGYSFVPPGIGNYGEPALADYQDMAMSEREAKARALLAQAGFGPDNPLQVEIRYNTSENHKNTALAIADMWKPLGVEVSLLNTDTRTHYAHLRDKGDFAIARAGWIGDYSDPQNFLFLVESDNKGFNYANYDSPEYDALMDKAAMTVNLHERAAILKQAEEIFMRDLPFIPLLHYGSLSLVSDRLKGWQDNIQNIHPTRWMRIEQ